MKGIALILSLIIFSTSIQASAFVGGVMGAVQGETTPMSCCSSNLDGELKECETADEEKDDEGCCKGDSCNCKCCAHIVYVQHLTHQKMKSLTFKDVQFGYSFLYHADYLTSVFHPPSI